VRTVTHVRYHNVDMTDEGLVRHIRERNAQEKPTYLLRMECERWLRQRGV